MSRKIIYAALWIATIILSLIFQNYILNRRDNETLNNYSQEVIELKEELKEKEKTLEQKEMEMESFRVDFSRMDADILSKFHPDGRIYNVSAANIAFYPNADLTGRMSERFEFISDVSNPLEREDGITVYSYLTTKGVVYSDMRVSLYAR